MKILWLSPSPAGLSSRLNFNFPGGGWISTLEHQLKNVPGIELGVAFFHHLPQPFHILHERVNYYPVQIAQRSILNKIRSRIFFDLADSNMPGIQRVIDDFKPDLIQVFGTEFGLGEIAASTKIPLIIHIQGLLNPIYAAWLPPGFSLNDVLYNASYKNILLRGGFYHDYRTMEKRAKREEHIIAHCDHFFGRTSWDKKIIGLYKPAFHYYHCNELLRAAFYEHQWKKHSSHRLRIVTTINESIYKGLETVLQAAYLLRTKAGIDFEWNILGIAPGSQLAALIEKITRLRFTDNHIHFLGSKTGKDLLNALLNADLFIHPSHIDNSPNSVCEAMLLGMPVMAGNVGGISSLITHNETGLLYNSHDAYELAALVLDKYRDGNALQQMGQHAHEVARQRHDYGTVTQTVVDTYHSMTHPNSKKKSPAPQQENSIL